MKPNVSMDAVYRRLVEGITGYAIYMLTPDGTVHNWNSGAQRVKGYTAAEIVGRNYSCFFTEQDQRDGVPQAALDKASIEGRFEAEGWRVRKDGTLFRAHVTLDPILSEDGVLLGFAKTSQDITKEYEQQQTLRDHERHLRLLVQSVTDYAIYMLKPDGTVSTWNSGAERLKGYLAQEIVGKHFSEFYTPEDRANGVPETILRHAAKLGKFQGDGWRQRKDGSLLWVHVVIDAIHDAEGELIGFAKITHDLTETKQKNDELRRTKENLDLALSNMSQGLCLFDSFEQLVLCNDRFYELLHLKPEQVRPGMTFGQILEAVQQDEDQSSTRTMGVNPTNTSMRLPSIAAGQSSVSEEVWRGRIVSVNHRRLSDAGWVSTIDDITDRKATEDRILRLAHYDMLTNLPNRSSFRNELEAALRQRKQCALIYLDLDRFKPINDTLGHLVGDKVLQVVAQRISKHLRRQDTGSRQGGDEFAVLLQNFDRQEDAIAAAERLIFEIESPIRVNNVDVTVGASAGIAFSGLHGTDAETLLRNADLALYAAKEDGRGRYRTYEPGMERVLLDRQQLEHDIRQAINQDEFTLHYQPLVDVTSSLVTGYEALLRWASPTRGSVSPGDFIPFAEEHGLMPKIGEWVLRTACAEAAGWNNDCCIAVNLSPSQFNAQDMVDMVLSILKETGLPPHRLELEITETAMLGDIAAARFVLEQLRRHGVLIALDDFGTGYSSLSFLRSLPFTRIKIDKSFVHDLGHTQEALAIVRAVSGLCNSLGVALTGEGVETEMQLNILQNEGCHQVQGYLLGRPNATPERVLQVRLPDFHQLRNIAPGELVRDTAAIPYPDLTCDCKETALFEGFLTKSVE